MTSTSLRFPVYALGSTVHDLCSVLHVEETGSPPTSNERNRNKREEEERVSCQYQKLKM